MKQPVGLCSGSAARHTKRLGTVFEPLKYSNVVAINKHNKSTAAAVCRTTGKAVQLQRRTISTC